MAYHYKRKTPEEKKAELEKLTEQLQEGITEYLESDKYKEILHNFSKFYDYSYRNCMLIMLQNPQATAVASYTTWKNEFNRQVTAGEHGIKIVKPITKKKNDEKVMPDIKNTLSDSGKPLPNNEKNNVVDDSEDKIIGYSITYTFDISQTSQIEGKPVIDLEITHELQGEVHDFEELKAAVIAAAPVKISFEEVHGGAKGYFDILNNQIVVNDGMSEAQTLKTMIHETAHSILHSREAMEQRQQQGLEMISHDSREVQAESIAYVVSEHYGLDTSEYSFPYVANWASEPENFEKNLKEIKIGSAQIIEKMDTEFEEIQKQKLESTVQHVQEDNVLEKAIAELAEKLDGFARDFNPYDYQDQEVYPGSNYDSVYADVLNCNTEAITKSLTDVIEDDRNHEMTDRAHCLVQDIKKYEELSFNTEARSIAKELDQFFQEYSPSEYYLNEYYPGSHFDRYFSELRTGKKETADFLKIISGNKEFELERGQKADLLINKINDFQQKYSDKITENLELTKTISMKR